MHSPASHRIEAPRNPTGRQRVRRNYYNNGPLYRWYKHLREIDRQLDAGTLPQRLDAEVARLEQLEDELAKVAVPLYYSNELHVHCAM